MKLTVFATALVLGLTPIAAAADEPPSTPPESATAAMFRSNHVALRVTDLEASVNWWRDVFGAREVRRSRVPDLDPDIEIVFMHMSSGFHIELIGGGNPTDPGAPATIADDFQTQGYSHIGFLVADMNQALEHMSQFDVQAERRSTRPDYGIELAIIRAPSGKFVELYAPLKSN